MESISESPLPLRVSTEVQVSFSDPYRDDVVQRWKAQVEFIDDVMLVRDACPQLATLPKITEMVDAWKPCAVSEHSPDVNTAGDSYTNPDHRSSEVLTISGVSSADLPMAVKLVGRTLHLVEGHFLTIYRQRNKHAHISTGSTFDLLRYGEGQRFGEHVDVVQGHPVLAHRRLSVVGVCNDDFEGGDFVFRFPGRPHLTIPAEPGMLILFPSGITHPHEVMPVTAGTRYSVVAWYY